MTPDPSDTTAVRVQAALDRLVGLVPGDPLLRAPATERDLAVAEAHLGHRLPEDVRALYLLHDGQHPYSAQDPRFAAGLVVGQPFLPLTDVLAQWDQWDGFEAQEDMDEFASSTPQGFVQPKYAVRGWIPLTHDGGGNHVGVDLDPAAAGTVGQVITFGRDDDEHQVIAPSLLSYLEQAADLVAAGTIVPSDEQDEPGWAITGTLSTVFDATAERTG
ncbi:MULTISPECIES: SMI1/KNR4 family protein [unclassified Curtobacterium]|uniref:SMI1/KNR4 family protein n=1 Tax=unclassified Curtobacterium TaxID=257496 RepID=UPI001113C807|nr:MULTISPECIES: SMI1/KNR4 family protein [unclassified Curtobacterium]